MPEIILIVHNVRSCHNVGSLLRTAEGLGVARVYLTGYTPYPHAPHDMRLPHESAKIARQIHKTALGAEDMIAWQQVADVLMLISQLKSDGFVVAAVEQAPGAVPLPTFTPPAKIALVVGREVEGVEPEVLAACDLALEIPMFGRKESFNVVQAAAMTLYQCAFAQP